MFSSDTNYPELLTSSVPGIKWPAVSEPGTAHMLSIHWQLEQTQWWPVKRLENFQNRQLAQLLDHSYRYSPFYRQRLADAGYSAGQAMNDDFWFQIPPLTRQDIQDNPATLPCSKYPKEHGNLIKLSSSGSLGKPVTIHRPLITQLFYDAYNFRDHSKCF